MAIQKKQIGPFEVWEVSEWSSGTVLISPTPVNVFRLQAQGLSLMDIAEKYCALLKNVGKEDT